MKIQSFSFGILLLASSAFGSGGNGGIHGGNPDVARRTLATSEVIKTQLRSQVASYLTWFAANPGVIQDSQLRADLQRLLANGLINDVQNTIEYSVLLDAPCTALDPHTKVAMTVPASTAELPNAGVCFSASEIVRLGFSWDEVVALAVHEHAHHLRYSDEDHRMMTAIAASMKLYLTEDKKLIQEILDKGLKYSVIERATPDANDPYVIVITESADQKFVTFSVCSTQLYRCRVLGPRVWHSRSRLAEMANLTNTYGSAISTGLIAVSAIVAGSFAPPALFVVSVGVAGLFGSIGRLHVQEIPTRKFMKKINLGERFQSKQTIRFLSAWIETHLGNFANAEENEKNAINYFSPGRF